jgi:hypothetical protein
MRALAEKTKDEKTRHDRLKIAAKYEQAAEEAMLKPVDTRLEAEAAQLEADQSSELIVRAPARRPFRRSHR